MQEFNEFPSHFTQKIIKKLAYVVINAKLMCSISQSKNSSKGSSFITSQEGGGGGGGQFCKRLYF